MIATACEWGDTMKLFLTKWIDSIAYRWIDWRQELRVAKMKREQPEFAEDMRLHKVIVGSNEWEMVMTHTTIYVLADEAAAFLDAHRAKNYVQFDMMPRLDRGGRPIRFTVQWATGESPASQNARLRSENARLRSELDALRAMNPVEGKT